MLRALVLNNYVDQVKFAPQMKNLCAQIKKTYCAETERVAYQDFNTDYVRNTTPEFSAIIMSRSEALYSNVEFKAKFSKVIKATREVELLLGICGGHQLIAMAYGERVVAMEKTTRMYREVEVIIDDPLFEGLPKMISVMQSHEEMVEKVSKDLRLLACSEDTAIEAFGNPYRILYGIQFHPERNDASHPAGATILENFGRLVKR